MDRIQILGLLDLPCLVQDVAPGYVRASCLWRDRHIHGPARETPSEAREALRLRLELEIAEDVDRRMAH